MMAEDCERQAEREAVERLDHFLLQLAADAKWYWRWGDGEGGFVLGKIRDTIVAQGLRWPGEGIKTSQRRKAKI